MKSQVAILEARPETIDDDYHRLLKLAGLLPPEGLLRDLLVCARPGRGRDLGRGCPPWQIKGCAEALAPGAGALETGPGGAAALPGAVGAMLEGVPVEAWAGATLEPAPYRAAQPLPALESSLEKGLALSPHLRERRPLLLTSVSLAEGGRLEAAVSALAGWLAPERRHRSRIPEAEVLAEVLGLAGELFGGLGVVCDMTVLGIRRRSGGRARLDRNVLLAGNDPVAVDAVLARMIGLPPAGLPWLRLAQVRGIGNSEASRIELLGDSHLIDLDFQIPEDSFAAGKGGFLSRLVPTRTVKDARGDDHGAGDSPWQRLLDDHQTGAVS